MSFVCRVPFREGNPLPVLLHPVKAWCRMQDVEDEAENNQRCDDCPAVHGSSCQRPLVAKLAERRRRRLDCDDGRTATWDGSPLPTTQSLALCR